MDKTKRIDDINFLAKPLRDIVNEILQLISINKLDMRVFETIRSPERQLLLFKSKTTKTMKSWHLSGQAVDFVYFKDGKWNWDDINKYIEFADMVKGKFNEKLIWGGDWGWDLPHWELKNKIFLKKDKNDSINNQDT